MAQLAAGGGPLVQSIDDLDTKLFTNQLAMRASNIPRNKVA